MTLESCGNMPGSNQKQSPKRAPSDRYTSDSYRQAVARACDAAFPPPEELSRKKVKGTRRKRALRWETPAEWQTRLGKEGWQKLVAWRESHRWHPHQLRHNMATRVRRDFGIDLAQIVLGHQLESQVTEVYAEVNTSRADEVLAKIG
jgi:integrase